MGRRIQAAVRRPRPVRGGRAAARNSPGPVPDGHRAVLGCRPSPISARTGGRRPGRARTAPPVGVGFVRRCLARGAAIAQLDLACRRAREMFRQADPLIAVRYVDSRRSSVDPLTPDSCPSIRSRGCSGARGVRPRLQEGAVWQQRFRETEARRRCGCHGQYGWRRNPDQ
jgi:hypothetical protein